MSVSGSSNCQTEYVRQLADAPPEERIRVRSADEHPYLLPGFAAHRAQPLPFHPDPRHARRDPFPFRDPAGDEQPVEDGRGGRVPSSATRFVRRGCRPSVRLLFGVRHERCPSRASAAAAAARRSARQSSWWPRSRRRW
ncbi:hypothetical protein ACU686_27110 [Yinghuangia aomiensis]